MWSSCLSNILFGGRALTQGSWEVSVRCGLTQGELGGKWLCGLPALPIYSLGGDLRFSAFTRRLLAVDFSSSVLFVSIISPSSVEITCCCFRGFFLGEAPGGRSLGGMDRLLASKARDGDTVLVARGGTVETGLVMSTGSTSSFTLISGTGGPRTVEGVPPTGADGVGAAAMVVMGGVMGTAPGMVERAMAGWDGGPPLSFLIFDFISVVRL